MLLNLLKIVHIFKIFTNAPVSTITATFSLAILTVVIKFSRVLKTLSLNKSVTTNRSSSLSEYTSSAKLFLCFWGTESEWVILFSVCSECRFCLLLSLQFSLFCVNFATSFCTYCKPEIQLDILLCEVRIDTTASEKCLIIITRSLPVQIIILTGSV